MQNNRNRVLNYSPTLGQLQQKKLHLSKPQQGLPVEQSWQHTSIPLVVHRPGLL